MGRVSQSRGRHRDRPDGLGTRLVARFVRPGEAVLIVGAGSGRDVIPLVERHCRVTGIDPAAAALGIAREVLRARQLPATLIEGFFEDVAVPGRFDVVMFSYFSYSYVPEARRRIAALRKAASCLTEGGRVLISYAPLPGSHPLLIRVARAAAAICRTDWRLEPGDHVAISGSAFRGYTHAFADGEIEREAQAADLDVVHHVRYSGSGRCSADPGRARSMCYVAARGTGLDDGLSHGVNGPISMLYETVTSWRAAVIVALLVALTAHVMVAQVSSDTPDLAIYARIRDEGTARSHVMTYASELMDGIGPRLTGSPGLERAISWAMTELTAAGSSNVRKESWGEFGMGWRQRNVWVRLVQPYAANFVVAPGPWSPATPGEITADVVSCTGSPTRADLRRSEASCAARSCCSGGRRVCLRRSRSNSRSLNVSRIRRSPSWRGIHRTPLRTRTEVERGFANALFAERISRFFADEGVRAVMVPSGNNPQGRRQWWHVVRRLERQPGNVRLSEDTRHACAPRHRRGRRIPADDSLAGLEGARHKSP